MSNRKIPRSPVERGIFCFPVFCSLCMSCSRRYSGYPPLLFLSVFLSAFSLRPFLRSFLRHCMPASFVCSFRRIVSGMFIVPLCQIPSGIFPSPSLSCCLPAVLFLFFAVYLRFSLFICIFCIFLYFSAFLFAHIKNSSYLCTVFRKIAGSDSVKKR